MTELQLEGSKLLKWTATVLSKEESAKRKKIMAARKHFATQTAKELRKVVKSKDLRSQIVEALGLDTSSFCKELMR